MKNASQIFRKISVRYLILSFVLGISLAVGFTPVIAQYFSMSEEKLEIIDPSPSEKKFATSTFVSLDTYTIVKNDFENTELILKRLDTIIKYLDIIARK